MEHLKNFKHMKRIIIIALFAFIQAWAPVFAQGYKIDVSIKNLEDSTVYLGYYYGDKQFAKDTLQLNSKGKGSFTGDEALPGGIYFILVPGNIFFELVIDKDQTFEVNTKYTGNPAELTKNLKSSGSDDMDIYLDYQHFMTHQSELAIDIRDRLKNTTDEALKTQLTDSLELLHKQVKAKWTAIEEKYPDALISAILRCNQEVEVPDPPRDENGVITDSSFQYRYYKKHYFDYVDLTDDRLIRTQFLHSKLAYYFDKLIIPAPDTVIKESKIILDKTFNNEEVFKYTLQYLFNKYNNSNIMGMDKAFVFFAENYYLNGVAYWADSTWLKKVEDRVREIKPNLIGNKAPEIRLYGLHDEIISLHHIDAEYTIIFFFEPSCGHCKKATPLMKAVSEKYWEKGVEVLAVYTQVDKKEWTTFIEEQGLENWINAWDPYHQSRFRQYYDVRATPSIYLLDKNKYIIGKRIDIDTVDKILEDKFKEK